MFNFFVEYTFNDHASPCSATSGWFSLIFVASLASFIIASDDFLARIMRCSGVNGCKERMTASLPVEKRRKTQEVMTKGKVKTGRWKVSRMGERVEWRTTVTRTANRCRGRDLGEDNQCLPSFEILENLREGCVKKTVAPAVSRGE